MSGARREEKPGRPGTGHALRAPAPCPLHLLTGALAGQTVVMAWAGAGAGCAAGAAGALLQRGAGALLAGGVAGALAPALGPGGVLAAPRGIRPAGRRGPGAAGRLA